MPSLIYDAELQPAVANLVQEGRPARIVAPFWGTHALQMLGIAKGDLQGRLEIICDLIAETTSTAVVKSLISRGAQVRSTQNVHAKAYFNQKEAIIGSANVSRAAFRGYEDDNNRELCVQLTDTKSLKALNAWWQERWDDATPLPKGNKLTRQMLSAADHLKAHAGRADLLEAVRRVPDYFKNTFVRLDFEDLPKEVEKKRDGMSDEAHGLGPAFGAWVDWDDMPPSAEVINFSSSAANKPVTLDCIVVTPDIIRTDKLGAVYAVVLPNVGGYKLEPMPIWLNAARAYQKDLVAAGKHDGDFLPLLTFVEKYLG